MSSSSSSSNNSGNGDSSNALALAPAPASDASGSGGDADGASAFVEADAEAESAAPKRPVYRPFVATHQWQVIEHDHILPPGLWIKFDFDSGVQKARLQPVQQTNEQQPLRADDVKTDDAPPAAAAAAADSAAAAEPAQVADASVSAETAAPAATPAAAAAAPSAASAAAPATHSSSSAPAARKASKAPKAPKGSRGMSTSADKSVYSSARRPVVYPTFPVPTSEFLGARAPMRRSGPIISVAPMVDVTDRHYRYMMRLITKHTLLYTPMIVDNALIRAPHAHSLYTEHQALEHPLVAQLGGSDADSLARAAQICQAQGFQAININVGCPAPSASGHSYGACLMSQPDFPLAVRAVTQAVTIPVSIKCRIGLNKEESYEFFRNFVHQCHTVGGVNHFVVHARKALLNLRSAGKNLTVPPLNYDFVYRIKEEFPHLHIELNGGVDSLDQVAEHLARGVDGVMMGRAAWKQPYTFADVDARFYGDSTPPLSRKEVAEQYLLYVEREWEKNVREIAEFNAKHGLSVDGAAPTPAASIATATGTGADEQSAQVHAAVAADAANSETQSSSQRTAVSASEEANGGLRHGESYLSQLCPPALDPRTLLRPIGYLYTHEPGYRRFRLLFEEGLLRHRDWSLRHILERAMAAVEPPPPRDWGVKDAGYEYTAAAKAEMDRAREALAAGGPAAAARAAAHAQHARNHPSAADKAAAAATAGADAHAAPDADVSVTVSLASVDGESQCSAASANTDQSASQARRATAEA